MSSWYACSEITSSHHTGHTACQGEIALIRISVRSRGDNHGEVGCVGGQPSSFSLCTRRLWMPRVSASSALENFHVCAAQSHGMGVSTVCTAAVGQQKQICKPCTEWYLQAPASCCWKSERNHGELARDRIRHTLSQVGTGTTERLVSMINSTLIKDKKICPQLRTRGARSSLGGTYDQW